MRWLSLLSIVAAALILAACSPAPADSGVRGIVTIGPVSPVQQQGESGEAPYEATMVVRRATGRQVAEFESGPDGRFSVNLPPGTYVLEPQNAGTLPFARPLEVTVEPHRFTEVTVRYDSGIR